MFSQRSFSGRRQYLPRLNAFCALFAGGNGHSYAGAGSGQKKRHETLEFIFALDGAPR